MMLAVEKLMPESLLNFRFRGTTVSYAEVLIALLNNVIHKASTVPTGRHKKLDSSAPMDIGMAAKGDGENSREEGDQRIMDIALQAVYKGTGKGN